MDKGPLAVGDRVLVPNGFRGMREVPVTEVRQHPTQSDKQVVIAKGPGTGTWRFVWSYGPAVKMKPGIGRDHMGRSIKKATGTCKDDKVVL